MPSPTPPDKPSPTVMTQNLSKQQRLWAGGAGLAMMMVAAYAVVKGDDGATSVAFVVAGCAALALALLGYLPLRIKYKDAEVDLRREIAENVIDPIASDMNESELQQSAEELTSKAAGSNAVTAAAATSRIYEHIGFERAVLNGLKELSKVHNWGIQASLVSDLGFDAQLNFAGQERPLFVEARLSLRITEFRKLAARLKGVDADVLIFVQDETDVKNLEQRQLMTTLQSLLSGRRIMVIAWNIDVAPFAIDYMATGSSDARESLDLLVHYLLITGRGPKRQ